jgi:hypothetical protein
VLEGDEGEALGLHLLLLLAPTAAGSARGRGFDLAAAGRARWRRSWAVSVLWSGGGLGDEMRMT